MQRTINNVKLQGSGCGSGYWNILYNSILNIKFTKSSKAAAFSAEFVLAIRNKTERAAENI